MTQLMSLFAGVSESSLWRPLAINVIVQLTVIVAVAGVIDYLLARWNPSFRHAIWVTALASVLASPLLAALLAGRSGISPSSTPQVTSIESIHGSAGVVFEPASQLAVKAPPPESGTSIMRPPRTRRVDSPAPPAVRGTGALGAPLIKVFRFGGLLWAVGAAVCFVRVVWGSLTVVRLQLSCRPLGTIPPARVLDRVRRTLGREKLPAILESSRLRTPACLGFILPAVAVPLGLLTSVDEGAMHDVIAHEAAHAFRRDPLVGLLQRIAQTLFWPHPLIYLLNARLSRAREEVCDNHVLRGTAPASYAKTLLIVQELAAMTRGINAPVGMMPAAWHLARRVEGLLSDKRSIATRPHFWRAALAGVVVGGVALGAACSGPTIYAVEDGRAEGSVKSGPAADQRPSTVPIGSVENAPAGAATLSFCDVHPQTFPVLVGLDGRPAIATTLNVGIYPRGTTDSTVIPNAAAAAEAPRRRTPEFLIAREHQLFKAGDVPGIVALYFDAEGRKWAAENYGGQDPAQSPTLGVRFLYKVDAGGLVGIEYVDTLKSSVKGLDLGTGDPDLSNVSILLHGFAVHTRFGYKLWMGDAPDRFAWEAFCELTGAYPCLNPERQRNCNVDAGMTRLLLTLPPFGDEGRPPEQRQFPLYVRLQTARNDAREAFVKQVVEAYRDGSEAAIGALYDAESKKDLDRVFGAQESDKVLRNERFCRSARDIRIAFAVEGDKVQYLVLYNAGLPTTAPATMPDTPQIDRLMLLRCSVTDARLQLTAQAPSGAFTADRLFTSYDSFETPIPSKLISMLFGNWARVNRSKQRGNLK